MVMVRVGPAFGVGMSRIERIRAFLPKANGVWLTPALASASLLLAWWLRRFPTPQNALLYGQLQFTSGILALTFAAAALVRFRAARDRLSLILASGFVIVGIVMAGLSFVYLRISSPDFNLAMRDPMTWVISRTLLGMLLVAALVVEKHLPTARNPTREIALTLVVVVLSAGILSTAHWQLPAGLLVFPGRIFPRPGNLFPAALFLVAANQYQRRLVRATFPSDYALYYAAALNLACCLSASQSDQRLDAPFVLAGILQFTSFAVLLGGALLDDIQLFENVRHLSVSDPLTGLANYRRLVEMLENEIQRSGRSGRSFTLLLLDLDGLKKINDRYGHLVGSRALCRVAEVLRHHSRSIDTCARYGGDEFAVIMPETTGAAAQDAAIRICDRVAHDAEEPPLSISAGSAVYPKDGEGIESLFNAADRALYLSKGRYIDKVHAVGQS